MNVVVVPRCLAALETNFTAGSIQPIRQMRLDENPRYLRMVLQPLQHPARSLFVDLPDRWLRLKDAEVPA